MSLTLPLVASLSTLMRMPYNEFVTVLPVNVTPDTVLPDAIEPIDMPVRRWVLSLMFSSHTGPLHTMAARASIVLKHNVRAGVDSDTVILVLDN